MTFQHGPVGWITVDTYGADEDISANPLSKQLDSGTHLCRDVAAHIDASVPRAASQRLYSGRAVVAVAAQPFNRGRKVVR